MPATITNPQTAADFIAYAEQIVREPRRLWRWQERGEVVAQELELVLIVIARHGELATESAKPAWRDAWRTVRRMVQDARGPLS